MILIVLQVVSEKAFDCEKLRFEHRFCPIALEPDCFPSYDLFSNAVSSHVESARKQPHLVLAQAADSFSDAKTLLSDIRVSDNVFFFFASLWPLQRGSL